MQATHEFRDADLRQVTESGRSIEEVRRQLHLFEHPPDSIHLERPCTPGDGIRVLTHGEVQAAHQQWRVACAAGRMLKFVPASGAATRMFKSLLALRGAMPAEVHRDEVGERAVGGDADARDVLAFMEGLRRFAFFEDLAQAMRADGLDAEALAEQGRFGAIIDYLLEPKGLGYASLPKGLLAFHRYDGGRRTAFEEHLLEAAGYVRDERGLCRLHFTVSPQHRQRFEALLERVRAACERDYDARFEVGFSVQKESTDTIAVDLDNRPVRNEDGSLLFRPGGHGALIENLNDLHADIISIKNIDNVLPDHLKPVVLEWKKVLAGYLAAVQQTIFAHLAALTREPTAAAVVGAAERFARDALGVALPATGAAAERRASALRLLNRPIRVCGMVRNTGEPGGGPFWVRDRDGRCSLQIVESAQVRADSEEQRAIFAASTHFNPVDLLCGVRDWQGRQFDLTRYVDPDAVFIARKSQDGRPLKALELPGLWNGGMADWTTIFVEIPGSTFCPVKSITDLLRPEHQPE